MKLFIRSNIFPKLSGPETAPENNNNKAIRFVPGTHFPDSASAQCVVSLHVSFRRGSYAIYIFNLLFPTVECIKIVKHGNDLILIFFVCIYIFIIFHVYIMHIHVSIVIYYV